MALHEMAQADFREGARIAVLAALDEYVRGLLLHEYARGAKDAELPELFKCIDAHADKLAARINEGTEPGSAHFKVKMERHQG